MNRETWFSEEITNITKMSIAENDKIDRYKTKLRLTTDSYAKIQFIHKQYMTFVEPFEYFYVSAPYEYRPDLLSDDIYGSPLYAWAILAANDMKSIFDFKLGISVKVPSLIQVLEGLNR